MNLIDFPQRTQSIEAEQTVIGALLLSNDAVDRIPDLKAEHFFRHDHRLIYAEIVRQIVSGKPCDAVSLLAPLQDKMDGLIAYLTAITNSVPSAATIRRHADSIIDSAMRRAVMAACTEIIDMAGSSETWGQLADMLATKLDAITRQQYRAVPRRIDDTLSDYVKTLEKRADGTVKPIATGFTDLDKRLDGGLERGTLTVIAARPGMGKSAMGLSLCRNVAEWGSSAFLSMEMSLAQVNDRNIAALGNVPIHWLRDPRQHDKGNWDRVTAAFSRAQDLTFYIDDQTGLNMLDVRNKARHVKRVGGLDLLVIDQLSFITGGNAENRAYELGEYTRGMLALAKELDIAVVLLCQLNRDCEKRGNKRPILSDLASSGSIEQDAANVIFLYRDEMYDTNSRDKGVCEVITAKQRQGEPGTVGLAYIGAMTKFENLDTVWRFAEPDKPKPKKGFA
jgi:replicative DNA helicase